MYSCGFGLLLGVVADRTATLDGCLLLAVLYTGSVYSISVLPVCCVA